MLSRYNLKRRVAALPPLSSEIFTEKVLTAQASSTAAAAKASYEKNCQACQKTYYSENAYRNHLGSQKHRLKLTGIRNQPRSTVDEADSVVSSTFSLGEPIKPRSTESIDADAEAEFSQVVKGIQEAQLDDGEPISHRPSRPHHSANEDRPDLVRSITDTEDVTSTKSDGTSVCKIPLRRCMFCNYDSTSLEINIIHMNKVHGLFIPEQSYLVDLEGLITYLYEKVTDSCECLYCHKVKASASGIQTHMRDKGHCMIAFESDEEMIEVGQFYDFSSTYSDSSNDDFDVKNSVHTNERLHGRTKLGQEKLVSPDTIVIGTNGEHALLDGEENTDGWETDSSASSPTSEDHIHNLEGLPLHRHGSHADLESHILAGKNYSQADARHTIFRSDYELHLPSGRTVGHRSLARYYRQNLHNYPSATEQRQDRLLEAVSSSSDLNDSLVIKGQREGRQSLRRANREIGMLGVTDAKKREIQALEKKDQKHQQRKQQQHQWGLDKRGNSQKHYRDPLLQ